MARAAAALDEDAVVEVDRLHGFPHPRQTMRLFGQEQGEQALLRSFASGHMHHAWLVCGRSGIGKATLAYRFARHVLAKPEERRTDSLEASPGSSAARQVAALSHPDLLVLRRAYDPKSKRSSSSIPVDEVRRLKSFLGLTGGDNAWRVVIIDSADELNPSAANALLKSLEEPPRRALFVLISSEPSGLLPTIRSRCQRLELRPLRGPDLRQAVQAALETVGAEAPSENAWMQLELLAEGSVRRGLQLAAEGGLEDYERVSRLFAALPEVDWPAAHALADALSSSANEQRFAFFFELLLEMLGRLARDHARDRAETTEAAMAKRLIPAAGLSTWAGLWGTLVAEKAETDLLNLDRKAFMLRTFGRLQQVAEAHS
jgi:DNA polymerase-3 subunit delta'